MLSLKNLNAFRVINNASRISSIDVYRCLAIVSVVLYHYNVLPFGFSGVDLFFVISGLLVGDILTRDLIAGHKISFGKFFLQRGFKIWPSFYAFILFGSLLAWGFYSKSNPAQVIAREDIARYVFFYRNYTGKPFHWSFDHVWSLCVEEHFYIMLPLLFLLVQYFIRKEYKITALFFSVGLVIIAGILFKYISYFFTAGKDTDSATHNRIDALGWGVLLNLLFTTYGEKIKSARYLWLAFVLGAVILSLTIYFSIPPENFVFYKICFPSLAPFSFFLMILGTYYIDFSVLKPLRFIAYYSYNWYLWHPVFVIVLQKYLGQGVLGVLVYLTVTFLISMIATILIEEPFLKHRKRVLNRLFIKNEV